MSASAILDENKQLQAQLEERDGTIADRDATIEKLVRDVDQLKQLIDRLGANRKSGHLIAEGQGVLFADESQSEEVPATEYADEAPDGETAQDQIKRKAKPKGASRKVDTSVLERIERLHELPPDQRFCSKTGLPLEPVGAKVFEEIEYQRSKLLIICHRQIVYGLGPEHSEDRQAQQLIAPMPPRPLEHCAASAVLLAWILVQKYANHLPLYRQEAIFARDGLRLPRQTMCDWVLRVAELLKPIADCLMDQIRAGPVMQLDDTPVKCQGGKGHSNFQAYLWTFATPEVDGVVYRFTSGRASELISKLLVRFEGFLVGDGYAGNTAAADMIEGDIVLTGCWAHSTRKFREARAEAPGTATLFTDGIKALYAVESEATVAKLDPEQRLQLRRQKSRPILAKLLSRGRRMRDQFSDAGVMAKAIGYMLNQRKPLRRFLENGLIPIDNNRCERSIRPIAIGRRNWLFAGNVRGGEAAAVTYTLIECCRLAEVDMVEYLADVMVRVKQQPAKNMGELLPKNWAKLRKTSLTA